MRMVVVLPAPFGPRKPRISPFSTRNEIPSTAVARPYLLVRPSTSIMRSYLPCLVPWTRGLPRRSGLLRLGAAGRGAAAGGASPAWRGPPRRRKPCPLPRRGLRLQHQYHSDGFFRVSNQDATCPSSR